MSMHLDVDAFAASSGAALLPGVLEDNFSMTQVSESVSLFVVCDGHGPFGHLAAFRVVQSSSAWPRGGTFALVSCTWSVVQSVRDALGKAEGEGETCEWGKAEGEGEEGEEDGRAVEGAGLPGSRVIGLAIGS